MATGVSVATAPWGKRNPNQFIDTAVVGSGIINRFTFYDGIKSKMEVPIADATLVFGTDLCVFDPQSTIDISEKELTVSTKKWAYSNCKQVLESTYRSELLKKGQNNAETMDVALKQWAFMYFAKLAGAELLDQSYNEIKTEVLGDSDVNKPAISASGTALDADNILGVFDAAIRSMPALQKKSLFGQTDRDYRPSLIVSAASALEYAMAMGEKVTTDYRGGISALNLPPYRGFEVAVYTPMLDTEVILAPFINFTFQTDSYADVQAIQVLYKPELSSDYWWGQFKAGFSYLKSDLITFPTITFA